MKVYPICLANLHDRKCVVIGGGAVAEQKIRTLLDCQARVVVISPTLTPRLCCLAEAGKLTHMARAYQQGDLAGAFLCIAATPDRTVNEQVWHEGETRGVLVNVVDDAVRSHFAVPAILRRGDLVIAISTGGLSPVFAVRIKEKLAAQFGPEIGDLVQILGALRPRLIAELGRGQRCAFVDAVLDSHVPSLLRAGDRAGALVRIEEILESCREQEA